MADMEKKIILGVLAFALLAIGIGIEEIPGPPEVPGSQFLPWQIEATPQGSTRVFGLTLGESVLRQAEQLYRGGAELSLFVSPQGAYKLEAYFDKVVLGGFNAQLVLGLRLPQEALAGMFERGARISNLGGGRKKVILAAADSQTVFDTAPIVSIAYLSRARLDADLVERRFGDPAQRIREAKTETSHWLYPALGLDVALHDNGHAVLQYVSPKEFTVLQAPLSDLPAETAGAQ